MRCYPDPLTSPSRPRTSSPRERREGYCKYEGQFSLLLDNQTNRDLAAKFAEVKRVASANMSNISTSLKLAEKIDCRKNGVGSAGGHVARRTGAAGPLNGYFTFRKNAFKYYHTKHLQVMDGIRLSDMKINRHEIVTHEEDWDKSFIHANSLRPHTAGSVQTEKDSLFDESLRSFQEHRRIFESQKRSGRDSEESVAASKMLKEKGVDAYRINYFGKKNKKGRRPKSSPSNSKNFQLNDESTLTGFTTVDWDSSSLPMMPGSVVEKSIDDSLKVSFAPSQQYLSRVEIVFNGLLEELYEHGEAVSLEGLQELAYQMEPPYLFLPLLGYFCVLLDRPVNPVSAVALLEDNAVEFLSFLQKVKPMALHARLLRKASQVRQRFFSAWKPEIISVQNETAGKLLRWILAFETISEVILAVFRVRSELSSNSPVVSPDHMRFPSPGRASESFCDDEGILRQFYLDLCHDQTCLSFWRKVYAVPVSSYQNQNQQQQQQQSRTNSGSGASNTPKPTPRLETEPSRLKKSHGEDNPIAHLMHSDLHLNVAQTSNPSTGCPSPDPVLGQKRAEAGPQGSVISELTAAALQQHMQQQHQQRLSGFLPPANRRSTVMSRRQNILLR